MVSHAVLILLLTWLSFASRRVECKQVDTIYGPVDGNTVTLDDGTVVNTWYGIPFAKPPINELRFEPPQPPDAWTEVFNATELPNLCYQTLVGLIWLTHPGWNKYSEDCLNINVYAPDDMTGAPYPVMVWIHGGAYSYGGNVQYPGHFLAAQGVIVVVPNYRLGAFGFLSSADGTVKGNMAMFDQVQALQWVKDNVANFGGNPNQVTIFGESAGGASTALQTVSPLSKGLFHRAIVQSGAATSVWSISYPEHKPDNFLYQIANKTDCLYSTDKEIVDCLRAVPPLTLMRAQSVTCEPGYYCVGWAPVIDGPDGFLPKLPIDLMNEQTPEDTVPTMDGICKDDGSVFSLDFVPEANDGGFNRTMFNYYLRNRFVALWAPQLTDVQIDNVYEALRFNYAPWPYLDDLEANRQATSQITTDSLFGYPFDSELKLHSTKNPKTYGYVFSHRSLNASTAEWLGVIHGADVVFVFGQPKLITNPAVRNDSGMHSDAAGWLEEDVAMADFTITLWTNFAKYSDPTPDPVKNPFDDSSLVTWEAFSFDNEVKILDINRQISMIPGYLQRDYAFYTDYLPYVVGRRSEKGTSEGDLMRSTSAQSLMEKQLISFLQQKS